MTEQQAAVNESLTDDERHLVLAAHNRGLLRTRSWPDVAAQLLVRGLRGEAIAELAGLSRSESPWVVDGWSPTSSRNWTSPTCHQGTQDAWSVARSHALLCGGGTWAGSFWTRSRTGGCDGRERPRADRRGSRGL